MKSDFEPKTIFVSPLNWGLGHSTRCIPIIRRLLSQGHQVILGSDGVAKALLEREFPALEIIELPSYKIRYHKRFVWLRWLLHAPVIYASVRKEHRFLQKLQREKKIDLIISDNRYGVYCKDCPTALITHQIYVPVPRYYEWFTKMMMRIYIKRYDEVWIPDFEEEPNLTGQMSHPKFRPHVHYIGPLSRFEKSEVTIDIDLLCIFSGPEPLRTHFETWVVENLRQNPHLKIVVVRGITGNIPSAYQHIEHIEFYDLLPSQKLNDLINRSNLILSRSGYTSIMDYVKLGTKAILVPTPGQPEQELLAVQLAQMEQFSMLDQGDQRLQTTISDMLAKELSPSGRSLDEWQAKLDDFVSAG